jgi:ribosome modulation factor
VESLKVRKHVPIKAPSYIDAWCRDTRGLSPDDEKRVSKATLDAVAELSEQAGPRIARAGSAVLVNYNGRVDLSSTLATIEVEMTLKAAQPAQPMMQTSYALYQLVGKVHGERVYGAPVNVVTDLAKAREWDNRGANYLYRAFTREVKPNTVEWSPRTWGEWYLAGYKAAMSGNNIKRSDCPILEGTRNETDWLAGWDQGDKDAGWKALGEIAFEQGKTLAYAPAKDRARRFWTIGYRSKAVDAMAHSAQGFMWSIL